MLARLLERGEKRQLTAWGDWGTSTLTASGQAVTVDSATQLLAVYGSVRLITDQIATLPIDTYREVGGVKQEIPKPDWLVRPTVDLEWHDWCGQVLHSLLLSGNAYINVVRGATGAILELPVADPAKVTPVRSAGGMVRYVVNGREFPGEILHIKGLMRPGDVAGMSPLEAARQSVGSGLAAQEYAARQFDSDLNMPGVIEIPGAVQPEQMAAMAESWRRKRAKGGKGLPGVLQGGATWKPTSVTNEQAQFLQTRQWTAAEIAGQVFLLDASDLNIPVTGTSLTYANLTDRNTRRVQVTLMPWIVRLERAISALMARPRYMKFNVDALLRGNIGDRFAVYESASRINTAAVAIGQVPVLTTAEMRDLEDLAPIDPATMAPPPNADTELGQSNSAAPYVVSPAVTVNMAEQRAQALPPPNVNVPVSVHVPESRVEPIVNVTVPDQLPPNITVTTEPTPVVVNVANRRTVRSVERDEAGRIVRVIDEDVE